MTRIVTSTELKQKTGEILAYVIENKEEVIIQRYDVPKAVIVDYESYQQMVQSQRDQVFDRLRQAAERVSARAAHLSEEERDKIISEAITEARAERRARREGQKGSAAS